jgi:hypothetical protein
LATSTSFLLLFTALLSLEHETDDQKNFRSTDACCDDELNDEMLFYLIR